MDAMILAAGRGARLKPITNTTPKPLVEVHGLTLIELQLLRLRQYGVKNIVINIAHLSEKIEQRLGKGEQYNTHITYSRETEGALETAGGIVQALPLLTGSSFLIVNADIICNLDYAPLIATDLDKHQQAHLVMVPNPHHHREGDFNINQNQVISTKTTTSTKMTFSGIAQYRREVFDSLPKGKQALAPILKSLISDKKVGALQHHGIWHDVGTLDRLKAVRENQAVREYINSLS